MPTLAYRANRTQSTQRSIHEEVLHNDTQLTRSDRKKVEKMEATKIYETMTQEEILKAYNSLNQKRKMFVSEYISYQLDHQRQQNFKVIKPVKKDAQTETLRNVRLKKGFSALQVAKALNMETDTYLQYEQDTDRFTYEQAQTISKLLGSKVLDMFF